MNWREHAERGERLRCSHSPERYEGVVVVEYLDGFAVPASDPRSLFGLDADESDQYVARPPEMS